MARELLAVAQVLIIALMLVLLAFRSIQAWRDARAGAFVDPVRRTTPAFTLCVYAMVGTAVLVILLPEDGGTLSGLIRLETLFVWVASIWLVVRVWRTGTPEWLVPPGLRNRDDRPWKR